MSFLPAFEIGFWNAWILMLVIAFHPFIMIVVDKTIGTGNIFKKMGDEPTESREKRDTAITLAMLILLIAYSIFLPLRSGTAWLYAGLLIWLVGLVIFLSALVIVAKTPMGHIFNKGIYRLSRHPLYLSMIIILLGVGVASASWIFLMFTIIYTLIQNRQIHREEQDCLQLFRSDYKDYMDRTPMWIGIPKKAQ
jgi:protein-S-isoprenylcysteine O-methyltransferase Ste14